MVKKTHVYLDIIIGNEEAGRITFELHTDVAPKTSENFRALCTGEKGVSLTSRERLHYLGCKFFKTIKSERIICGDIFKNDGSGPGESIYGSNFMDEPHTNRHGQAGVLAMETQGDGKSNNSQFYITLRSTPHLNRLNVVFGQVTGGMDIIRQISRVPCDLKDNPRVPIVIVGCGEIGGMHTSVMDALSSSVSLASHRRIHEAKLMFEVAKHASVHKGLESSHKEEGEDEEEADEEDIRGVWSSLKASKEGEVDASSSSAFASRLKNLERLANASRRQNERAVVEEERRNMGDGNKMDILAEKSLVQDLLGWEQTGDKDGRKKEKRSEVDFLAHETAVASELKAQKRARKEENERFGWDVFNAESTLRAHEKRVKNMKFDQMTYELQKKNLIERHNLNLEEIQKMDKDELDRLQVEIGMESIQQGAVDRAVEFLETHKTKKEDFSRRRAVLGEEDVTFINRRNEKFNKKLERAYGEHTKEIKHSLERGTAL